MPINHSTHSSHTITGAAAVDTISTGNGADLVIQAAGAAANAGAAIAASATVYTINASTFDVVADFSTAAGDLLRLTGYAGAVSDLTADGNGAIVNNNATVFQGTFNAGTGAFVAGDGTGADAIAFVAGAAAGAGVGFAATATGTQGVVLLGAGNQAFSNANVLAA